MLTDARHACLKIRVKQPNTGCRWIWGAFKMPARSRRIAYALARAGIGDEYFGTLVNAWLARGGEALGVRAGSVRGCRDAGRLSRSHPAVEQASRTAVSPHQSAVNPKSATIAPHTYPGRAG